jgi:hypothetical protein
MMQSSVFNDDMVAPCPDCGGRVQFMSEYDHPPELGGDWLYDFLWCSGCHHEWNEDSAPPRFMSADREYWLTFYIAINDIGGH